jgi:hypothetical protein
MVGILHEEVRGVLAVAGCLADERVLIDEAARGRAAMRELPGEQVRGRIILDVLDATAALENERFESLLTELLRRPAAGDAGADDDRVEGDVARAHGKTMSRTTERSVSPRGRTCTATVVLSRAAVAVTAMTQPRMVSGAGNPLAGRSASTSTE